MAKARLKRRSVAIEDREILVAKTITSAAIVDSGKLNPAKYSPDPEELTGPRNPPAKLKLVETTETKAETPPASKLPKGDARRNKQKATVSNERIDKIRDVKAYDPAVVSDAALRDDFRILLGWHSKRARDDDFEHSFETIEAQLRKLLKEAAKRGPTAIQFDPKGMSTKVRPVFERLARAVKLPKASFKQLVLKADTDPGDLTTAELCEAHNILHTTQVAKSRGSWGSETIVNMHARVVDELNGRGFDHPAPPNDGLDHSSTEFEQAELEKAQQVHRERTAISRDELSKPMKRLDKDGFLDKKLSVFDFGCGRGDDIAKLKRRGIKAAGWDPHFLPKAAKTKSDVVNLGYVVNVIESPAERRKAIREAFKLAKKLLVVTARLDTEKPDDAGKPYKDGVLTSKGTFQKYYKAEELRAFVSSTLKRKAVTAEAGVVYVTRGDTSVEKREPRVASAGLLNQAKRSFEDDSVIVGEFVFQPKPTAGPAQPEEVAKAIDELIETVDRQSVEKMLELYDERPELFPAVVQKCSGGARHQIHKAGEVVSIYSEDGEDHTARLPGIVQEVQTLKAENLVLDVELDIWKGRERRPHEETIEYLARDDGPDDSGITANVFDMLYTDAGDIHAWPTVQRLKKLAELEIQKAEHLSIAPAVKVSDLGQLERAARMLGELPGSEGVVSKHVEAGYPLTKSAEEWVEFRTDPAQVQEKQADPFLEIPNEGSAYRYVVQHHWQGKEVHSDFRVELRSGKLLIGWRLRNQTAGVVKDPVTTLPEARAWRSRFDELSKVDWRSGGWSKRSIDAERMAPAPFLWLDVEGKTKDPEVGKAPPVGGSSEFPGVFHIVDQGEVEYGAQKPWMHEYFVQGDAMRYRLVFRQLKIGELHKKRHAHAKCMHCATAKPQIDVVWADGRGRAWFCRKCYPIWLKSVGGPKQAELIGSKAIVGGRAPEVFGDVHKSVEVAKSAEPHPLEKRAPLNDPEKPLGSSRWAAMQPDDMTPHVLSSDAVGKQWMPPVGVSALPKAVRDQVPKDRRYWLQRTTGKARKMRDELVAAMAAGDVEIDVGAPFVKISKAAAPFVLQAQTWEGSKSAVWHLRIDTGKRELLVMTMQADPIESAKVIAKVGRDPRKASLKAVGLLKPGHYLNPTKTKRSTLEVVDKGSAEVLSIDRDFIKLLVKGKRLKGTFTATRNEGAWVWAPFDTAKAKAEAEIEKQASDLASRKWFVPVQKIDKDKRLVTGIVLEPGEVDAQNDTIKAEVIERASIKFLTGYNSSTQLGVMHKVFGDVGLELAHSWIALEKTKIGGKAVKKGSWLMTMRVVNDKLWKKVKSGELGGFSIGGLATVR